MWTDEIYKQIDAWIKNDDCTSAISNEIIDRLLDVKKQIEKEKIITRVFFKRCEDYEED